ncbi:uncharacterized protein V1518DRAFT_416607 [Limtongia smithiae]|uniref:uncharacterized protein n=1 Tax=Limtongia smithiae TaxID=1125753 RepID=UPI0034CF67C4
MIALRDILNPDAPEPTPPAPTTVTVAASPFVSSSAPKRKTQFNYQCVYAAPHSRCHADVPARKVVSHIFGRNKRQTLAIPEHVWVTICRRHYQRESYRKDGFPIVQVKLILLQLEKLEKWGRVSSFAVVRSRPKRTNNTNNTNSSATTTARSGRGRTARTNRAPAVTASSSTTLTRTPAAREAHRAMLSYIATATAAPAICFSDVRILIRAIHDYLICETDISQKVFPSIELLPNIAGPLTYTRGGRHRLARSPGASESFSECKSQALNMPELTSTSMSTSSVMLSPALTSSNSPPSYVVPVVPEPDYNYQLYKHNEAAAAAAAAATAAAVVRYHLPSPVTTIAPSQCYSPQYQLPPITSHFY